MISLLSRDAPSGKLAQVPTYKLVVEYDGTRYSGWQKQTNTRQTIQGHLTRAASDAFGEIDLGGAGRTDAGVHASGQVAHLRMRGGARGEEIVHALNDRLPHDIHVISAVRAKDGFHARHDAVMRIYLYQISRRRTAFSKPFVWWVKDRLDDGAMSEAARLFAGMHDFAAFTDRRLQGESTQVLVDDVEVANADDLILVRIVASHFLWKMVRKMIAALVEVGRNKMRAEDIARLLEEGGPPFEPTAPPSGLFLEAITYEGEEFTRRLEPIVPVTTPVMSVPKRRR